MASKWMALAAAALVMTMAGAAAAQEPTAVQKERQAHFKQLGRTFKGTQDELKKPTPDLAVLKTDAKTIDDLAGQLPSWFPAGSGAGGKTEALPAIWQKPAEFKLAAEKLANAAHTLNGAAQAGNVDGVKAAIPALGGACKNCHENFKAKDEH